MPKPTTVEIVAARRKGITGYANVGRGTALGNPFKIDRGDPNGATDAVDCFRRWFHSWLQADMRRDALALLSREWPEGVVRIACPCNGALKGEACHATVVKEFLEGEIALGGGE
jgi:hypothetical protein